VRARWDNGHHQSGEATGIELSHRLGHFDVLANQKAKQTFP
jgi:hypothetical protein